MGAFCFLHPVLQGRGTEGGLAKVEADWQPMVLAGWQCWFPTNCLIFSVVPLHFRPLAMNLVSLGWSMYMSKMN